MLFFCLKKNVKRYSLHTAIKINELSERQDTEKKKPALGTPLAAELATRLATPLWLHSWQRGTAEQGEKRSQVRAREPESHSKLVGARSPLYRH